MKYVIVGCHYCGTTSLEKYLKDKNMDVIRNEGLFTLENGYRKFGHYHKGRIPIIIIWNKKKELWEQQLKNWLHHNPVVVKLEEISQNSDFPHELGKRHD